MVPLFAITAMDGFAVRARDTAGASEQTPVKLRIVGEVAAGHAPTIAVGAGEAVRIMTGAPVPAGADAIVMVERTRAGGDSVAIFRGAVPGDHVRPGGGCLGGRQAGVARCAVATPRHRSVR